MFCLTQNCKIELLDVDLSLEASSFAREDSVPKGLQEPQKDPTQELIFTSNFCLLMYANIFYIENINLY